MLAGALGVRLEKPGAYELGAGNLPIARDIERSVKVFHAAVAVSLGAMLAAYCLGRLVAASR